jgi:hypothetical protein
MRCYDERAPEPARPRHRKPPYRLATVVPSPGRGSVFNRSTQAYKAAFFRYKSERNRPRSKACEKCGLGKEPLGLFYSKVCKAALVIGRFRPALGEFGCLWGASCLAVCEARRGFGAALRGAYDPPKGGPPSPMKKCPGIRSAFHPQDRGEIASSNGRTKTRTNGVFRRSAGQSHLALCTFE